MCPILSECWQWRRVDDAWSRDGSESWTREREVEPGAWQGRIMRHKITENFRLLHGPYRAPRCRVGDMLTCELRGRDVEVGGMSAGLIQWPTVKMRSPCWERTPTGRLPTPWDATCRRVSGTGGSWESRRWAGRGRRECRMSDRSAPGRSPCWERTPIARSPGGCDGTRERSTKSGASWASRHFVSHPKSGRLQPTRSLCSGPTRTRPLPSCKDGTRRTSRDGGGSWASGRSARPGREDNGRANFDADC